MSVLPLAAPRFARRIFLLGSENAFKIAPFIREIEANGRRVIRCNIGEPDFPLPAHIAEEVKRQIDRGQTHYVDPQGIEPLRRAIAKSVGESRGITVTPDRVVVFAGAKPPIGFSQHMYCDPGHEVIYPTPAFPIYESFTQYVGAVPVPLHLSEANDFTCTGDDLARLITARTRLLYLNFPSNPTGGVATAEQLRDLARVIRDRLPEEARVYSDEVYESIVFDGETHRSIASLPDMADRTIIVSGVSKSYSWTGGRVGWAVYPTPEEATVARNLNINYVSCVCGYNQLGAKVAIESPESAVAIAEMVASFQHRRNIAVEALNDIPGITCRLPKGAFYVFPNIAGVCHAIGAVDAFESLPRRLRERTSPSTLFQRFLLFRYCVAALDRRSFGVIGSEGEHYLRLSVATALDDLQEALRRIAEAARDRDGFRRFIDHDPHLF